jgi:plasmid stabilization system protein ParE
LKRLRIQEPARREFAEATKWYLERDAEAAVRFAAAVRLVFDLISELPQVGGAASGVGDRNVRSMPVQKFP